jgi:hypothetical protein
MTSYQNSEGEFTMTAAEMRFEASLDAQPDVDDFYRESTAGCGTTGCEKHDGECANNWSSDFDDVLPAWMDDDLTMMNDNEADDYREDAAMESGLFGDDC